MTREQKDALLNMHITGMPISQAELMRYIVDLFWELDEAKGRIHELEETLDGRG